MAGMFSDSKEKFKKWWQHPPTQDDRFMSALFGMWAGMWLGGLGRVIYETPVSIGQIGYFALCASILGAIIGAIFPKASRIMFYPFIFLGVSCSGT
jgi:hypothetical protein